MSIAGDNITSGFKAPVTPSTLPAPAVMSTMRILLLLLRPNRQHHVTATSPRTDDGRDAQLKLINYIQERLSYGPWRLSDQWLPNWFRSDGGDAQDDGSQPSEGLWSPVAGNDVTSGLQLADFECSTSTCLRVEGFRLREAA